MNKVNEIKALRKVAIDTAEYYLTKADEAIAAGNISFATVCNQLANHAVGQVEAYNEAVNILE